MTVAQRNSRQVRDAIRRHRVALRRYRRDESHDVEVWFTEEYGLHYAGRVARRAPRRGDARVDRHAQPVKPTAHQPSPARGKRHHVRLVAWALTPTTAAKGRMSMTAQLAITLGEPEHPWQQVTKFDRRAVDLVDGIWPGAPIGTKPHYSRQTPGSNQFMASGETLILLAEFSPVQRAVWGAILNMDPVGELRFRCSIFRNETPWLSSYLIREATPLTQLRWWREKAWRGTPPLTTEVDPEKTRRKRDPGRCFRRAGWRHVRTSRGLYVFEAPPLGQVESVFLLLLLESANV